MLGVLNLFTGGALRLGALICQAFAQAGWQVWCHYQRSAAAAQGLQQALAAQGAKVHLVQADLGQAAERERMMHTIESTSDNGEAPHQECQHQD